MPQAISEQGKGFQRAHELGVTLECFGQYIRDERIQFGATGDQLKDLAGLRKRAEVLNVHEVGTIVAQRGDLQTSMSSRQSIWRVASEGAILDQPVAIADVSERYTLFDHRDMIEKIADAVQERGVNFRGEIHERGNQMHGTIIFEDPKFDVPLLTLFKDHVKIILKFQNSVDGSLRFGGSLGGIRMICINWNLWGEILGEVFGRHTGKVEQKFSSMLDVGLDRAHKLLPVIGDKAWEDDLDPTKTYEIMLGAHTPPSYIPLIVNQLPQLEPLIAEDMFNRYTLYNAVTAFVTRSNVEESRGDWLLKSATRYLTKTQDQLVKEGEQIIAKNREKELENEPVPVSV